MFFRTQPPVFIVDRAEVDEAGGCPGSNTGKRLPLGDGKGQAYTQIQEQAGTE